MGETTAMATKMYSKIPVFQLRRQEQFMIHEHHDSGKGATETLNWRLQLLANIREHVNVSQRH